VELNTASAVISFARKLEEDSASLYEALAQRWPEAEESWLTFVRENRKNIVQAERAYYGVISDALEGCFAFGLNVDDYAFPTSLPEKASHADALGQAVKMEEQITRFYSEAAEQSKSLMADVPRAFAMIARKREGRITTLKSLPAREN